MTAPDNTPVPTKKCRDCGGTFEYRNLRRNNRCIGGVDALCKQCDLKRAKIYRQSHGEETKAHGRVYRQIHREEKNARQRAYHQTYREVISVRAKVYRQSHHEELLAFRNTYRQVHREEINARKRAYSLAHPDSHKAAAHRRRALKRGLPRSFTTADWTNALNSFNGGCAYCGCSPSMFDRNAVLHADHYIPLSDHRPDNPGTVPHNMVPACQRCNHEKRNIDPVTWIVRKFGKRKAKAIITRIEVYFAAVRRTEKIGS